MSQKYTIDKTVDEFGQDRFFIADENADWIEGPFDTYELAAEAIPGVAEQQAKWQSDKAS